MVLLQESCQPGIPANGADPRRLLPMHGAGYPQFGPLAGASSTPGTNYAGKRRGGGCVIGKAEVAAVVRRV